MTMPTAEPVFLSGAQAFPDPCLGRKDGLIAYGGDLSPARLKAAYQEGIFPWFGESDPVLWWSPDPRCVFFPDRFVLSKSTRRFTRRYRTTLNQDFDGVIGLCAATRTQTWITPSMQEAYKALHRKGWAHSVEVYEGEVLVGGLYGVCVGSVFSAESMVSLRPNASKVALWALCTAFNRGLTLVDAQVPNPHLMRLGAVLLPREAYVLHVKSARNNLCGVGE